MEGTALTGINVREIPLSELEQLISLARGAGCRADVTTLQAEIDRRTAQLPLQHRAVEPELFRAAVTDALRRRLVGPVSGSVARKCAETIGAAVADALVFSSVSSDPSSGLRRLEP